jgi:tripartite-type tricarboxylate transporter receptor subunit TctC
MTSLKTLMGGLLVAAVAALLGGNAFAEIYPNRPIIMTVGYAAGGPADVVTRVLAQALSDRLGQPVVVENKPGAGGRLALRELTRAAPDGYTISLSDSGFAVNPVLYSTHMYDPIKDFTPIIYLGEMSNYIAVTPSLNVKTLRELIDYAKAHPGKLNYAATASSTLLAAEMFKATAGIDIMSVRYKGAAYGIPALLAGQVQVMVSSVGTLTPYVKHGKVIALAVTTRKRTTLAPEVPTTAEAGLPGMVYANWYCIVGPAGMPRPIVDRLNSEFRKVMADPNVIQRVRLMGIEPTPSSPDEFSAIVKKDLVKLDKLITAAKLKIIE